MMRELHKKSCVTEKERQNDEAAIKTQQCTELNAGNAHMLMRIKFTFHHLSVACIDLIPMPMNTLHGSPCFLQLTLLDKHVGTPAVTPKKP